MTALMGPIINGLGIVVGSVVGIGFGWRLKGGARLQSLHILGLVAVLIGLKMAWPFTNPVTILVSLVVGGWIGSWLGLHRRWERAGTSESGPGRAGPWAAMVTASLIFDVGSMAVLGALQSGLTNHNLILKTKAVLDGVTAMLLAASMGWGVVLAAATTVLYEGGISVAAHQLSGVLHGPVLQDASVAGGFLIAGIGVNFLRDEAVIPVANFLPALILAPLVAWVRLRWFTGAWGL